jgi:hypothetical protein
MAEPGRSQLPFVNKAADGYTVDSEKVGNFVDCVSWLGRWSVWNVS